MNRKQQLREEIEVREVELHRLEVEDWWSQRPHILRFRVTADYDSNDEGGASAYFRLRNVLLNEKWIYQNEALWYNLCHQSEAYPLPLVPDEDELIENWDTYLRDIFNPSDWDCEFPDFERYDDETLENPNYAN